MIFSRNDRIEERIRNLKQNLEYSLELNQGSITQETIIISQQLDKLIVLYYQQKYI